MDSFTLFFKPPRGSILRLWRAPSPRGCSAGRSSVNPIHAFKAQGSRGGFAATLDDAILVSTAFPSRGRCPAGADRAPAVCKTKALMSPSLLVPSQLDTFVTVRMRCPSCSSLVYVIRTVRLYPPSASDAVEVTVPSVRDADVSVTVTLTRRPFTESVNL